MLHLYICKLHKTVVRKENNLSIRKRLESFLKLLRKSNFAATETTFKSFLNKKSFRAFSKNSEKK